MCLRTGCTDGFHAWGGRYIILLVPCWEGLPSANPCLTALLAGLLAQLAAANEEAAVAVTKGRSSGKAMLDVVMNNLIPGGHEGLCFRLAKLLEVLAAN